MSNEPPIFPAGEYQAPGYYDDQTRSDLIAKISAMPARMRAMVKGMTDEQLDTKYRNWTIRQIVHHVADSHMNCYIRFKWALTEESPLIKAYDESLWSEVVDAVSAPVESSLLILAGLHARWAGLLEKLADEQMEKSYFHPQQMQIVKLSEALPSYVWHADHHLAQIAWLREQHGWD